MTRILGIDPGTTVSAWVMLDDGLPVAHYKLENDLIVDGLGQWWEPGNFPVVVIEEVRSYGMPVGREVLDTVRWTGRFQEAALRRGLRVEWLGRKDVVLSLCGSPRGNDATVRRALLDRFGPKGTKAAPGALYGFSGDEWAALAVAVAWHDAQLLGGKP